MSPSNPSSPSSRSVPAMIRAEIRHLESLKGRFRDWIDAGLLARVDRAIQIAECPTCAESQADGVPCSTSSKSCDQCSHSLDWVRGLRKEIEQAIAAREVRQGDSWEI